MAKRRSSPKTKKGSPKGANTGRDSGLSAAFRIPWKFKLFLLTLIFLVAAVFHFVPQWRRPLYEKYYQLEDYLIARFHPEWDNLDAGTPSPSDRIVKREGYALGFSEKYMQPLWVTYKLTAYEAENHKVKRTEDFRADWRILTGSATPEDYIQSGFDRGHLAPAADMAWSSDTMHDSFYMSNMTPQVPEFNRGVWKDLESQVRAIAKREGEVYVVTGPVFYPDRKIRTIGENHVAVPHACYKVIYSPKTPSKAIGFVLPNSTAKAKRLESYACTVDAVEALTGLDFFSAVAQPDQEAMESTISVNAWNLEY